MNEKTKPEASSLPPMSILPCEGAQQAAREMRAIPEWSDMALAYALEKFASEWADGKLATIRKRWRAMSNSARESFDMAMSACDHMIKDLEAEVARLKMELE